MTRGGRLVAALAAVVVFAVAAALFAAVWRAGEATKQETLVFGARAVVVVRDLPPPVANAAINSVFADLQNMHRRFYPWRAGELQNVNQSVAARALPIEVSAEMAAMLGLAKSLSAKTDGLFNPAIGGLVSLWGFHRSAPPAAPPPAAAIAAWRQNAPNMRQTRLVGNTLTQAPAAAVFDFGGFGKGAALDRARQILRAAGARNALVQIGGGVAAMGKNGKRPWRVALRQRANRPPLALADLHDGEAVAVSGDSERFFEHDGGRYHHILDPRSGMPASRVNTAVVVAAGKNAGAVSDAVATALVIANRQETQNIMRAFGLSLSWQIGADGENITPAMRARL